MLLSSRFVFLLFFSISFLLTSCINEPVHLSHENDSENIEKSQQIEGQLRVHFMDVGQGDAILFQGEDVTILVDAGRHERNDVVPYLESVGIRNIDALIGTHPHADHIGQFPQVLQAFPVTEVWMSGATHTTKNFENTIEAILASEASYEEPRAGDRYKVGSLTIEIMNPQRISQHLNNSSISFRATFGHISFVLTGDAEEEMERDMISRGHDLRAHILHLGHHGSNSSNTVPFLNTVQPEVAIYSAGSQNSYGHPHEEVIKRVKKMGIALYGTDVHGTIIVTTDGNNYTVTTEK